MLELPSPRVSLQTAHGPIPDITWMPDATRAVVRTVDAEDVDRMGIDAIMVNAFHVSLRPGARRVQRLGGLHRFMGWDGPIVTDSGGFQALSLIRENPKNGSIQNDGLRFKPPDGGKTVRLTPEKTVQIQFNLGTDVVICLDDCTDPAAPREEQERSVTRTIAWARRGFEEHARRLDQWRGNELPPRIVGVIQGGLDVGLRTRCAEALVDLGFDAYGFGGWPINEEGRLHIEMFELLHSLLPPDAPRFALGVGRPEHLVAVSRLGASTIFDCALPTRDARRYRLFRFTGEPLDTTGSFWKYTYLLDEDHAGDNGPVDETCDGPCCTRYSRAYIHHLARIKDPLGLRLSTLHNLRFYARLVQMLRDERAGSLA